MLVLEGFHLLKAALEAGMARHVQKQGWADDEASVHAFCQLGSGTKHEAALPSKCWLCWAHSGG